VAYTSIRGNNRHHTLDHSQHLNLPGFLCSKQQHKEQNERTKMISTVGSSYINWVEGFDGLDGQEDR